MKKDAVNVNFNQFLSQKIPDKSRLATMLCEVLAIEKEAVYRRLRGDVAFTFAEAVTISDVLDLSLDQLLGVEYERRSPFTMQRNNLLNPGENEISLWESYIEFLSKLIESGYFKMSEVWTTLPFPLCYDYHEITRFYLYKWSFQFANSPSTMRFEDFLFSEELMRYGKLSFELSRKATETEFIISDRIFISLINDLKVFESIGLITKESIDKIYLELKSYLEYMEQMAFLGKFPEGDGTVSIYISKMHIDTSYTLIDSKDHHISLLRTIVGTAAATTSELSYKYIEKWFTGLKRFARKISVSDEKERLFFLSQQRDLIETLKK